MDDLINRAVDLLRASHDKEALAFALMRLTFHLFSNLHHVPEALEAIKEASKLAESIKHHEYIVNSLYLHAAILSGIGRLGDAEAMIQQAISMNTTNPRLYADCIWLLGMNYFRREEMADALVQFEKVLLFDSECKFESHYAHTLIIYGSVQMELKDYKDAEQSFRQSLSFYEEVKNPGAASISYERLGELYLKTGRIDEGVAYYRRHTNWAASANHWGGYIHTLSNMVSTFEQIRLADPRAREAYKEALEIAERENDQHSKARALRVGSWLELLFEEYDLALLLARESATIARNIPNYLTMRLAIQGIFKYAIQTKNLELAAWLKQAFLADPDTDSEILAEIASYDLTDFQFDKAPNLLELDFMLDKFQAASTK